MEISESNSAKDNNPDSLNHELEENFNDSNSLDGNSQNLKLLEAKRERQRAEENAIKLENRINLLEKERQKALKKVDDVKKKALEIMKIKQRNQEIQQTRRDHQEKVQEDLQTKQIKIQEMKAEHEEKLNTSKFNTLSNSLVAAKSTKEGLQVFLQGFTGKVQTTERRTRALECGKCGRRSRSAQKRATPQAENGRIFIRKTLKDRQKSATWKISSWK